MKFKLRKDNYKNSQEGIKEFIQNPVNKRRILLILIIAAVLTFVSLNTELGGGKKYVVDEEGNIAGIARSNSNDSSSYPLSVILKEGDAAKKYNVNIIISGKSVKSDGDAQAAKGTDSKERLINELVSDVENQNGKVIILPKELSDGTSILWERSKDYSGILIIIIAPILIYMLYYSEKNKKEKEKEKIKRLILKKLPGFNDSLLMLTNCGLIFNDAFKRIAANYKDKETSDPLASIIINTCKDAEQNNCSLPLSFERMSRICGVKDLIRLSSMINDNQTLGVDLRNKLEVESEYLWNVRKQLAEKRGKIAESKLAFPLALLLIVLVLIAAMPALLQF